MGHPDGYHHYEKHGVSFEEAVTAFRHCQFATRAQSATACVIGQRTYSAGDLYDQEKGP
jgi:hypothetical protein